MSAQTKRRNFVKAALYGSAAIAVNPILNNPAVAATGLNADYTDLARKQGIVRLFNTHTGEQLNVLYKGTDGQYIPHNLQQLNYLLRDHRQNELKAIDPRLFDQLSAIQRLLGSDETVEIISGYRSPKSNEMLRRTTTGVAQNSFHVLGRALDVRLKNVNLSDLYAAATELKAGGVGLYSSSDFIHLDTGPLRTWGV